MHLNIILRIIFVKKRSLYFYCYLLSVFGIYFDTYFKYSWFFLINGEILMRYTLAINRTCFKNLAWIMHFPLFNLNYFKLKRFTQIKFQSLFKDWNFAIELNRFLFLVGHFQVIFDPTLNKYRVAHWIFLNLLTWKFEKQNVKWVFACKKNFIYINRL